MSGINSVFNLSSVAEARPVYDDWAENYEKDMADGSQDYAGPTVVAEYVLRMLKTPIIEENIEILDAGCGTGLVGARLAKLGATKLDGIDLSPGMLGIARRAGIYRSLEIADLSQPLELPDQKHDILVCVGTLTKGHVGPQVLGEFVRVVKPGAVVSGTVRDEFWKANGYEAEIFALRELEKVEILSAKLEDYRPGAGVQATVFVLRVLGAEFPV